MRKEVVPLRLETDRGRIRNEGRQTNSNPGCVYFSHAIMYLSFFPRGLGYHWAQCFGVIGHTLWKTAGKRGRVSQILSQIKEESGIPIKKFRMGYEKRGKRNATGSAHSMRVPWKAGSRWVTSYSSPRLRVTLFAVRVLLVPKSLAQRLGFPQYEHSFFFFFDRPRNFAR